jgi:CDP-diacylglycerol--serine O-phosphatidyltransferase
MKKISLIPNIVTAFGLSCGLFVIFKVNMIEPGTGDFEMVKNAALLLILAAFADFIDGALARAFKAESEFGVMFDSLSDAISFGVAPSVLLLKTLSLEQGSTLSFLAGAGCMIFSLSGVLRLVRFTIKVSEKPKTIESRFFHKHFTGLPITAAAACAISANLIMLSPLVSKYLGNFSHSSRSITLSCIMVVLGYLMLSKFKFPSLKGLNFKVPSFHLAFLTVVIAIFVLYGVFYYFSIVLAVISWIYVLLALVLSSIRLIAGKKSKTLEDYEMDDDQD